MKILVLCADNPSPPITGSRIRQFYLWPILREMGHEVKILALSKNPNDFSQENSDIEFYNFNKEFKIIKFIRHIFYSFHQWPQSKSLEKRVNHLLNEWKPDIIHAEELRMGRYIPVFHLNKILKSICVHNVESELLRKTNASPFNFARRFFNKIYCNNLIRFEKETFKKMNTIFTYSLPDLKEYKKLYPEIEMICSSNGVNKISLSAIERELPPANKLLFLGSLNYHPNIESLIWFLDHIYPQFKDRIILTVAGSNPHPLVLEKIKGYQIKFFDTPLDLSPIYLENSLLLVPLLSGSGTRGKILESLMYGRPVLTTQIGCEGLEIENEQGIIVSKDVNDFADLLEKWLQMPDLQRNKIADDGRNLVNDKYTWNCVAKKIVQDWLKAITSLDR